MSSYLRPRERLRNRPVVASVLIAVLAGLLLRMAHLLELSTRLDSVFPDHYVLVRLIDFGFRMAMGAILVLAAIPFLLGCTRRPGWLSEYRSYLRLSMGTTPRRTVAATILSFLAFLVVLVTAAVMAGVARFDLSVLVEDNNWLILLAALIPGIWEELTFRGVVLSKLQDRFTTRGAIVASSVVFGLFHFSNIGTWDDTGEVIAGVIVATAFGIGWGYVVITTNSVIPTIVGHYLVDVILFDELFIDPLAGDDSTGVVYLSVALLYPLLTILITRWLYRTSPPVRVD